jgi:hypothetical protein
MVTVCVRRTFDLEQVTQNSEVIFLRRIEGDSAEVNRDWMRK